MKEFVNKLICRLKKIKIKTNGKCKENTILAMQYNLAINTAIDLIEELAEEYNNGWILCSERLPSESGEYLTYVDYADETFIAIDEIDCDGIVKEWNCTPNYHIIAWQPLPPAYSETN